MKLINAWHAILRIPYILTFAKLKFVANLLWKIDIWPRHSYLTKAFVPFQSDLDLSLYVSKRHKLSSFLIYYRILKFFLPFIGELNVYTPEIIEFIKKKRLNGFELDRDPILVRNFNIPYDFAADFSESTAAQYLAATLINDRLKLQDQPNLRIAKWQYHFQHVNSHVKEEKRLKLNESSLTLSIITAIVNLARPNSTSEAQSLRNDFLLLIKADFFLNFEDREEDFEWMKAFCLQKNSTAWLFFSEYVAELNECLTLPTIDVRFLELFETQINWIVLRMLRQSYVKKIRKVDLLRIEKLRRTHLQLFQGISDRRVSEIDHTLNETIALLKRLA